jgi:ATP-dependent exoDNAse (exonuclease V) alpha subunit
MDKIIREHDSVVLLRNLPDESLMAGDTGVVVYIYDNAPAFEVEFPNPAGKPRFLVVTVKAQDLLKLQPRGSARTTV